LANNSGSEDAGPTQKLTISNYNGLNYLNLKFSTDQGKNLVLSSIRTNKNDLAKLTVDKYWGTVRQWLEK
jgi:hypothetical protein